MFIQWLRPLHTEDTGLPAGGTSAETKNTDTDQQEHMIPKSRFDEVNAALRTLQQQQAEREQAEKQAADKAAAERGEFEKLASERGSRLAAIEAEHGTATQRLSAYEAEMEKQFKARLKVLPEAIREMAPEGDVLTRYGWLDKAEGAAAKLGTLASPRGTPGGPRGTGGTATASVTDADLIAEKRARIGAL